MQKYKWEVFWIYFDVDHKNMEQKYAKLSFHQAFQGYCKVK